MEYVPTLTKISNLSGFTGSIIHVIISKLPSFEFLIEIHSMSDRWLAFEKIAKYVGVRKEIAWIRKFKPEEIDK